MAEVDERVAAGDFPQSAQIAPITNIVFMASPFNATFLCMVEKNSKITPRKSSWTARCFAAACSTAMKVFTFPTSPSYPAQTLLNDIVHQGMGEPLHNFEAVKAALGVLCHRGGLQFSPNKVTVSTVGLVPQMRALVACSGVQLAVSLHATTDALRDWLAPANRKWVS